MVDEPYKDGPARSMGSARLTSSRSISMLSGWSQGSTLTGWRTISIDHRGLTAASTPATINSVRTLEHRRTQRQPPSPSQQSPISLRQDRSRSHYRSSTLHHG